MNWQNIALMLAGVIGSGVAVIHGVLVQRLAVRPIAAFLQADPRIMTSVRKLVPLLLHFSTVTWFLGGLALIAAANFLGRDAKLATGLCVGGTFLLGALGNFWISNGRHPGWMLMAAAIALIAVGVGKSGG